MTEHPIAIESDADQSASSAREALVKLRDNPWVVLGTLFLVAGVCGLPVLWVSRGFSGPAKVVWTILVLAYTGLVFWLFWLAMAWYWSLIAPVL